MWQMVAVTGGWTWLFSYQYITLLPLYCENYKKLVQKSHIIFCEDSWAPNCLQSVFDINLVQLLSSC